MTRRMSDNLMKVIFFLVIFMVLLFQSIFTSAQSNAKHVYKGLDVQFGTRHAMINSDIDNINLSQIVQAGGRIGLLYGNENMRLNLGAGYHSSTGNIAGTVDQYETGAALNIYPLSWFLSSNPRIEPYLTGGLSLNNQKFYGYYINREPGTVNYSQGDAPFLGSIRQVNASVGAGIEVEILDHYDFVHLYSEVRYGSNLSSNSTDAAFNSTFINKQVYVSVGISFGIRQ